MELFYRDSVLPFAPNHLFKSPLTSPYGLDYNVYDQIKPFGEIFARE